MWGDWEWKADVILLQMEDYMKTISVSNKLFELLVDMQRAEYNETGLVLTLGEVIERHMWRTIDSDIYSEVF